MPNLTTLSLVSGSASNTGTISTLDNSFGTAGTSNANVLSVQGIAGGTAQPVSGTLSVGNLVSTSISGVSVTASSLVVTSTSNLPVNISGPVVTVSGSSAVNMSMAGVTVSSNALQIYGSLSASNVTLSGVTVTSSSLQVAVNASQLAPLGPTVSASSAPVVTPTDAAPIGISVALTSGTSGYSTGYCVSSTITFTSAGRAPNSSGIIQDGTLTFKSVQANEFDLYIFNANPNSSTFTDKTSPVINSADVSKVIGVIKFTKNYSGLGTHTVYKPDETTFAPIPFSGSTIYGVLITTTSPSASFSTTSDCTVTLGII